MRQSAALPTAVAASVLALSFGVVLAASPEPLATVAWPPSAGLLVGEVVTGGASGSDEFVEIYNAASMPLDLGGLELAYVTSSGATVTRKASWTGGTILEPGGHLLVANSSGVYAPLGDALYSGGFAANGGSLVLRPIGGSPIDAVAWGDATNAFVEGVAATAPLAGQSIERRPGGLGGNGQDTNDNSVDLFLETAPAAQNLAAPPIPAPPAATEPPPPTPLPEPTPDSTLDPTPELTPGSTPDAATAAPDDPPPSDDPETSTSSPTPQASATPLPSGTPGPEPSVVPGPLTVAEARDRPSGSVVEVVATLTTPVGLVEGGTGAFVQDATGGIALYLASTDWPTLEAGILVRVHGSVDDRYAQRTVRLSSRDDIAALGAGEQPVPEDVATGAAGEAFEGQLIAVLARVVTSPSTLSDGFAVTVDDGSGQLRVVATAASGVDPPELPSEAWFRLIGPLGQRDSSGTGTQGYRLYLRSPLDIEPAEQPSPSPAPSAMPSVSPSAGPSATPSAMPTATPVTVLAIAAARTLTVGAVATVEGVVTVEAGRILDERTAVLQDGSGGLAVRLPGDGWPPFARGDVVRVTGTLAAPYGNLELRAATSAAVAVLGSGAAPAPRHIQASELGEALEGRLVRSSGVITSVGAVSAAGNYSVDLRDASGTLRIFVYGATGIDRASFARGATVEVTGVAGQRASSSGSTDGHRVWPRDRFDVRTIPPGDAFPGPNASPRPTGPPRRSIASAIAAGGSVSVEGTVTTPPGLVDADGRRVVLEDESGAILMRLPSDSPAPGVGTRIVAAGKLGTYYGSPQLELAEAPIATGQGSLAPRLLGAVPGPELGWRLVRVSGAVTRVQRLGASWRAELSVGGQEVPIYGAARAGIASTALVEGRAATVTGVVRPPYPTATDRRPAVMPRFGADVVLGSGGQGVPGSGAAPGAGVPRRVGSGGDAPTGAIDVDLAELAEHDGALVRVGGLVTSAVGSRVAIEDGSARATVLLPPDSAGIGAHLRPGDALNATGTVVADGEGWAVAPRSAADIARVGRLGELMPLLRPTPPPIADLPGETQAQDQGSWPIDPLPPALALVGTGATVLLRRRDVLELARRLVAVVLARLGRA